jgi:hypothetical protein
MYGMSTEYRNKHLLIGESKSDNINGLGFEPYSLAFFCGSWDSRCLEIIKSALNTKQSVLVHLAFRDPQGFRDSSDEKLADFLTNRNMVIIRQQDETLSDVLVSMCKQVDDVYANSREAPRFLIDLTGFPRYLSLGLISYIFQRNKARQIDVFYSEGSYADDDKDNVNVFTEGSWESLPIRSLEGKFDPAKTTYLLVSTGFEGRKTLRAVHNRDPDRISILLPNPGLTEKITARTKLENQALIEEYKVPESEVLNAPAADLISAMEVLDKHPERGISENIFYLCCGTKPHSLALALRACLNPNCAVIYHKPESYKTRSTMSAGTYWLYHIYNLAVFA